MLHIQKCNIDMNRSLVCVLLDRRLQNKGEVAGVISLLDFVHVLL